MVAQSRVIATVEVRHALRKLANAIDAKRILVATNVIDALMVSTVNRMESVVNRVRVQKRNVILREAVPFNRIALVVFVSPVMSAICVKDAKLDISVYRTMWMAVVSNAIVIRAVLFLAIVIASRDNAIARKV